MTKLLQQPEHELTISFRILFCFPAVVDWFGVGWHVTRTKREKISDPNKKTDNGGNSS